MEKVSRRINELETIHTNVKLLSEMVEQYNSQSSTESEKEMMKVTVRKLNRLWLDHCRLNETESNLLSKI